MKYEMYKILAISLMCFCGGVTIDLYRSNHNIIGFGILLICMFTSGNLFDKACEVKE